METERKYLDVDLAQVATRLAQLEAVSRGLHFESNTIFDTPDLSLCSRDRLLRLRLQEWPRRSRHVLTFKYPCAATPGLENVKAREELELGVEDGAVMAQIFIQLGYIVVARYEKLRESWRLAAEGSTWSVELDTLPFGHVVEIEGDPARMDAIADLLGLDKTKISLKTYHVLNQDWRRQKGLDSTRDLLFESAARARLRSSLGLQDRPDCSHSYRRAGSSDCLQKQLLPPDIAGVKSSGAECNDAE